VISAPTTDAGSLAHTPPPAVLQHARQVIFDDEWQETANHLRAELLAATDRDHTLKVLVHAQLLTRYQADAIRNGRVNDLLVGQYRLLEPLGRGGTGVVYRADHRHLRTPVAVKVMADTDEDNPRLAARFSLEARAIARLQHPNIVACLDAGREPCRTNGGYRQYFVMDLVDGDSLFDLVVRRGPLSVPRAAALFRQLADALAEAHRFGLVHRDIKPGNVMVTPDWRVKLLDFGMALHPTGAKTQPGSLLGTLGYMAPEQANNASRVDGRADVFALGATLFFALTGREPFPAGDNPLAELFRRAAAPPPRVRECRPELPSVVDDLVGLLMAPDPDTRPPTAAAVSSALLPFVGWRDDHPADPLRTVRPRVLIVDDDEDVRAYIGSLLGGEFECVEAADGPGGLAVAAGERFDLAVIDQELPGLDGARLIASILKVAPPPGPKVLYMSGRIPTEALGGLLLAGADDFIRKPFAAPEFLARVTGLLNRRAGRPAGEEPPTVLTPPTWEFDPVGPLADGTAELLEWCGVLTRGYAARLPKYLHALAVAVAGDGDYAPFGEAGTLELLKRAAVLHDLGMTAMPAAAVGKTGRLDGDERSTVQAHTAIGAEVLGRVAARYPTSAGLKMAADIALRHHERWDGAGYPDGLSGSVIPAAARLVAVASVYDALRSRRPNRPGLSHSRAVRLMTVESPGQFDPLLAAALAAAAPHFEAVFGERHRESGVNHTLAKPPA
jgi:response regulator RpfG family c-di-GMP phosphodiesterase